jgi:hypothetical protein
VAPDVWQAHLVKHPLGVSALRSRQPWNHEGWDATTPPVVTADGREQLVRRILALGQGGERCEVREFRDGRTPEAPKEPCYRCPPSLLSLCSAVLGEPDGPGRRYAWVIEALLAEVAEDRATVVPSAEVSARLLKGLARPAWIEAGTVLAVGVLDGGDGKPRAVARIARGDGTRADFYFDASSLNLTWRTTYRQRQSSVHTRWSFLLQQPAPSPSLPLSGFYVVPRGWWEACG